MNRKDIKRKYLKYVDDCVEHGDSEHRSYQVWLEQLVLNLANENSLLCPIADFDVITSLKTEKLHMVELISDYETVLKYYAEKADVEFVYSDMARDVLKKWRG